MDINYLKINKHFNFVQSKSFEYFVIFNILLASVLTGLKTYSLPISASDLIEYVELFITTWFIIEVVLRIFSAENKKQFFTNFWNVFDIVIVAMLMLPSDSASLAILARIVRILRILRLFSIVPQLRMLSSALLKAVPQLTYVVILMFVIFYIYAAIGATFFSEINAELWGDIGVSMLTLFRIMTFEDWTDVMYQTMSVYPSSSIYYISFIFITAFATLNLIIGIMTSSLESEQHDISRKESKSDFDILNEKLEKIQEDLRKLNQ